MDSTCLTVSTPVSRERRRIDERLGSAVPLDGRRADRDVYSVAHQRRGPPRGVLLSRRHEHRSLCLARALLESNRGRRIGFVTGLTKYLYEQSYAPQFAIFAKGEEAEKLIVVAYGDGTLDTVYRARALFATLTALSRLTPLFREFGVEELFTFFDLAKLLGFTQITVSDGKEFTHQITIR